MRGKWPQSGQKRTRKDLATGVERSGKYDQRCEGKQADEAQKADEIRRAQRTLSDGKFGPARNSWLSRDADRSLHIT